jgi:dTDP-4-amino-4,6-dideoxygalactose transaminase
VAAEVERLALHGLSIGAWKRFSDAGFRHYEVVKPGFKYNLTDLAAAMGLHQLPRLDEWIARRAELWERYDDLLADLPVRTPPEPDGHTTHARHLYAVEVDSDDEGEARDAVLDALHRRRIGAGVHYRGVHMHPYYRDRYFLQPEQYPVATRISHRTLSLPLSPQVTEQDQDDVVAALAEALADDSVPGAVRTSR